MSDFNNLMTLVNQGEDDKIVASEVSANKNEGQQEEQQVELQEQEIDFDEKRKPFDVGVFAREVSEKAENKNKVYSELAANISSYDISDGCIRSVVYKLLGTPVKDFRDRWLPLSFRATLGNACHDFIQRTTDQFSESEVSLKIPSIRFSGRLDNLNGNNVLVEIKSCTHSDYAKIIKDQRPRNADFYQTMAYKYVLENHLEEAKDPTIKTRSNKPKLNKYDIDTIQFIYLAHDITASDIEDFGTAVKLVKHVKKQLNSRRNPFYFITSLVLDTNCFDPDPYIHFVKTKIERINEYLVSNKLPPESDEFINKKKCFFCLYNKVCDIR